MCDTVAAVTRSFEGPLSTVEMEVFSWIELLGKKSHVGSCNLSFFYLLKNCVQLEVDQFRYHESTQGLVILP